MPTITTVDAAWTPSPDTFTDAEARRFDTAMFLGDGTANGVRGGIVYHGPTSLAVAVNGSDQVTVQAGAWVIPAATGLGVYRGALSATTSAVALSTRNGTNPRIDLIVVQAPGIVKTIDGTPSASPSAPALPAQHIELARVTVPQTGGGAVTVDSSWRIFATSIGGCLLVPTAARLPASGNITGQTAIALDTGIEHRWNGTGWISDAWTAYGTPTTILTGSSSNPTLGTGSSATAKTRMENGLVHFEIAVISGTSGTASGSGTYQFLLPTTPKAGTLAPLGYGGIQIGAGGNLESTAMLLWSTGTIGHLYGHGIGSASSGTFNVVANRRYLIAGSYEPA